MAAPAGQGDAQSQAALGMMGPMFVLLAVMLLLTFNPGLRTLMADSVMLVIEPTIPFHSIISSLPYSLLVHRLW